MVDERALDLGFQAFDRATADCWDELEAFRQGIEAYEAARWRTIKEAPRDGSWILVLVDDYTFPPGMIQWNGEAWVDNDLDCWDLDFLLRERAIYRTIDPPKQNLTSDHEPKESDDAA